MDATKISLFALAGLTMSLFVGSVSATPPSGSTCVGNYNPDAFANVCYYQNPSTPPSTYNPGGVTTNPTTVCIIGNLCEPVPVPTTTPSGPVSVPIPGTPGLYGVYTDEPGLHGGGPLTCTSGAQTVCYSSGPCYTDETCFALKVEGTVVLRTESYSDDSGNSCTWIGTAHGVGADTCDV